MPRSLQHLLKWLTDDAEIARSTIERMSPTTSLPALPCIELEVIAVPYDRNPETLTVIHAMPTEFRGGQGDDQKTED